MRRLLLAAALALSLLPRAPPLAQPGSPGGIAGEPTGPKPHLLLFHGGSFLFADPNFQPLTAPPAGGAGFVLHYVAYPLGDLPAAAEVRGRARLRLRLLGRGHPRRPARRRRPRRRRGGQGAGLRPGRLGMAAERLRPRLLRADRRRSGCPPPPLAAAPAGDQPAARPPGRRRRRRARGDERGLRGEVRPGAFVDRRRRPHDRAPPPLADRQGDALAGARGGSAGAIRRAKRFAALKGPDGLET